MSINKKIFLSALLIGLSVYFFINKSSERTFVEINGEIFVLEVARDSETRKIGLSGKTGLDSRSGMLFVFPSEGFHGIWMKDMNFSIDIVWISQNCQVVGIERDVSPKTYPKVFIPKSPAKFVIEVDAGELVNFSENSVVDCRHF